MKIPTILLCLLMAGCATKTTKPTPKPVSKSIATMDEPDPPCAPNCGTNGPIVINPNPPFTNGELFCKISSDFVVSVTNTSPFKEYALQFSDSLPPSWSPMTASQIGKGENFYPIDNTGTGGFYRAQDVTGDDVIVYPTYGSTNSGNSGTICPGAYQGYWVYRPVNNIFPFVPAATNTFIDPAGSLDTRIEVVGRFGDHHCGALPLTLTSLPDPHYSIVIYFKTVMMGTNYPIVLKGFTVRTDL